MKTNKKPKARNPEPSHQELAKEKFAQRRPIENNNRVYDDVTVAIRWKHALTKARGRMLSKCPFCNVPVRQGEIEQHRLTCAGTNAKQTANQGPLIRHIGQLVESGKILPPPKRPAPVVAKPSTPSENPTILKLAKLTAELNERIDREVRRTTIEVLATVECHEMPFEKRLKIAKNEVLSRVRRLAPSIRRQVESAFIADGWSYLQSAAQQAWSTACVNQRPE